jgi:hypothetical protein
MGLSINDLGDKFLYDYVRFVAYTHIVYFAIGIGYKLLVCIAL